jgi:hypothetical protein
MSSCTCSKDAQITCIVHPTELSLKRRIAELEAENAKLREALERLTFVAEQCDGWEFFPTDELDAAAAALEKKR